MKGGESERFDCGDCNREFEVVLEPNSKGPDGMKGIDTADVTHCPFCGAELDAEEA